MEMTRDLTVAVLVIALATAIWAFDFIKLASVMR